MCDSILNYEDDTEEKENKENDYKMAIKKQGTQIRGNRVENEEIKIEKLMIKLDKFGTAFKFNDKTHLGVIFNDNSQIVLNYLNSDMIYRYYDEDTNLNYNKTLLIKKGK